MAYTLEPLPYAYDALEPYLDKETMMLHHDKHHATYVAKLNVAIEKHPEFFKKHPEALLKDLNAIPEDIRMAVRNFGGGHVNHAMFWDVMAPASGGKPAGGLLQAIDRDFGGYEKFIEMFEDAATTQFGSGWAWLSLDGEKLIVEKTSNQDSPLSAGRTPLLCLDVWEHAYYLKYKNMRADYIKAWWNVVNWAEVEKRYQALI